MCYGRFTISASYRKEVERHVQTAQHLGHVRQGNSLLALLAVREGQRLAQVALILRGHEKTVVTWGHVFCCYGLQGAPQQQSTGRPPKLSSTPKAARATLREEGPGKAGCSGAGWRSPMIPQLIAERFGVYSNIFYIAELHTNRGFSDQKAALVSDHLDANKRHEWRTTPWPPMLRRAQAPNALLLFGAEASWPQWGTLTYTWARRGQQPRDKTSGKRQGYKVFGLIDSFPGRLFYQGQAGRLHAAASMACLTRVREQTTHHIVLMQAGAQSHTSAETKTCCAQQAARLQGCP